jgi:hypothetical protein
MSQPSAPMDVPGAKQRKGFPPTDRFDGAAIWCVGLVVPSYAQRQRSEDRTNGVSLGAPSAMTWIEWAAYPRFGLWVTAAVGDGHGWRALNPIPTSLLGQRSVLAPTQQNRERYPSPLLMPASRATVYSATCPRWRRSDKLLLGSWLRPFGFITALWTSNPPASSICLRAPAVTSRVRA